MIKQILAGVWLFITAAFGLAQASTIFVDSFEEYCALAFTDLPADDWYNGSVCANGTACASAIISITVAQSGNCTGVSTVSLFDGESLLATDSSPSPEGVSVFNVLIEDGAALELEARAFEADLEIGSSGVFSRKADFTLPQIEWDFQAVYNSFDDLAPETPGLQFNAQVEVADANVDGGQLISFTATGTSVVDLVPSNVTFPLTLVGATPVVVDLLDMTLADQQQHVIRVVGTDAAGNQGSVEHTAYVDLLDPEGTIIVPIDDAIIGSAGDADPTPGFQVSVTFATGIGAATWKITSQAGCNSSHGDCDAPVTKASGVVTNPDGEEPITLITLELNEQVNYHRIGLTTIDSAGNQHAIDVRVTVLTASCSLSFTDLPPGGWYNGSLCANGTDCASATATITVAVGETCVGVDSVELYDGESLLAMDSSPTAGGASVFNVLIEDSAELQLEARAFEATTEVASSSVVLQKADFTPPVVDFIAADVEGFQTAATGEFEIYTTLRDTSLALPGMQFNARVSVADTNVEGGQIISITATGSEAVNLFPSNVVIPLVLAGASPVTTDFLIMSLADQQTHTVSVVGTDAAGNQSSASFTALVDLSPRNPIVVSATNPPSPANENSPEVSGNADTGSTVRLYSDSSCTSLLASGPADIFNSTGITISVPDNSVTTVYANAAYPAGDISDCSVSAVSYVEDSLPPDPPDVLGSIPIGPANNNNPIIVGTAEAGSAVSLYSDSICSVFLSSGSAESFSWPPGIAITVPDNSVTTVYASATDEAVNVSSCSETFITYVEDSTL